MVALDCAKAIPLDVVDGLQNNDSKGSPELQKANMYVAAKKQLKKSWYDNSNRKKPEHSGHNSRRFFFSMPRKPKFSSKCSVSIAAYSTGSNANERGASVF